MGLQRFKLNVANTVPLPLPPSISLPPLPLLPSRSLPRQVVSEENSHLENFDTSTLLDLLKTDDLQRDDGHEVGGGGGEEGDRRQVHKRAKSIKGARGLANGAAEEELGWEEEQYEQQFDRKQFADFVRKNYKTGLSQHGSLARAHHTLVLVLERARELGGSELSLSDVVVDVLHVLGQAGVLVVAVVGHHILLVRVLQRCLVHSELDGVGCGPCAEVVAASLEPLLPRVEVHGCELGGVGGGDEEVQRLTLVDEGTAVGRHVDQ
eukprot:747154-Hanusia_phi.AAC.1